MSETYLIIIQSIENSYQLFEKFIYAIVEI